jgi:2-keto-myo-inositol isomerase
MTPWFALNGATTGPADLLTDVRAARDGGYSGLELRDTKLQAYLDAGGSLYALRQQLSNAGVEAVSINALERATLATGTAGRQALRRCRTMCEWAVALDCRYVVAVPSPLSDAPDAAEVVPATVEALRALAGTAAPYDIRIGFEFLGFSDCSVTTLAQAREIVAAVGHPGVGLVLDAFHFYAGGSTWEMLDGLDPAQLFVVHLDDAEELPPDQLTDAHRLLPGDGVIPLRDLVARLEALGYRGAYSIELFRPEYWRWDPVELAKVARQKMEALFTLNK